MIWRFPMPNRNANWIRAMEQEGKWPMYEPNRQQIESAARRAMPPIVGKPKRVTRWITAIVFLLIGLVFSILIYRGA